MKPIPNNLKKYRIMKGYTQMEVANLLGMVSSDRISHWEKGTNVPSIFNLFKLCKLYKVYPHEIYEEFLL